MGSRKIPQKTNCPTEAIKNSHKNQLYFILCPKYTVNIKKKIINYGYIYLYIKI